MTEHLVFTLCATLAAMGEFAGHERRGTLTWPGRSAVLGLLAAARGIRRDDAAGLAQLETLQLAIGIVAAGQPLRDYHTVETVPTAKAKKPDSRPAALRLAGRETNTTITLRDYRMDVCYLVAVWGGPLDRLAEALQYPAFTLYLGRKSCPLSAPPAPRIIAAPDALAAMRQQEASLPPFLQHRSISLVAADAPLAADDVAEQRHDLATDRAKWHFAARQVYLHYPKAPGGTA